MYVSRYGHCIRSVSSRHDCSTQGMYIHKYIRMYICIYTCMSIWPTINNTYCGILCSRTTLFAVVSQSVSKALGCSGQYCVLAHTDTACVSILRVYITDCTGPQNIRPPIYSAPNFYSAPRLFIPVGRRQGLVGATCFGMLASSYHDAQRARQGSARRLFVFVCW